MKKVSTVSRWSAMSCAIALGMLSLQSIIADGPKPAARQDTPQPRRAMIHSHNDYAQKRPFWGAYEAGAHSIEADIYIVDGDLLVAHLNRELKPENTLRRLYLEPIRSVFKKNGGKARADGKPLQLVIDLKNGEAALLKLVEMIEKEGLRPCFDVKRNPSAVRLVAGGAGIKDMSSYPDYVFFSVKPGMRLPKNLYGSRIVQITQSGRMYTKWRKGKMSEQDKAKIRAVIDAVHAKGCNFRLWGFPDHPEAWKLVHELGADYINTDHPADVAAFLRKQ